MWSILVYLSAVTYALEAPSVAGESGKQAGQRIIERHRADEKKVLAALTDPELWRDAGPRAALHRPKRREAELLGYLKAATVMRSKAFVPVLVKRLAFSPYEGLPQKRRIPTEIMYPAYPTLKSIGIPAIPALVDRLRSLDPDNRKPRPGVPGTEATEFRLAWQCIADIYAEKQFYNRGIPYAMLRVRFEIDDLRKKTRTRNTIAEKRLERAITDMQIVEAFLKKK